MHTYWENTPRKANKGFLGRGIVPPKLNRGGLAVVTTVDMVAAEPDGTCETLGR
jgi:hypothetical protein